MGEYGHPHARLQRALERGNPLLAATAAAECAPLQLPDALALCPLYAERAPERYEAAAARLLGRLCLELPLRSLAEAQAFAAALSLLPARRDAGLALLAVFLQGSPQLARRLERTA